MIVAVAAVVGIGVGTIPLSPIVVWHALGGQGDPTTVGVVRTLRLPRTILGALVGAGLGMSGAALQGSLRNPLAEPYLLGVSGGAAVGAVIASAMGLPPTVLPVAAFVGAILAVAAAFSVARIARGLGDARVLLMAGVVVGAFANAVIMLILANAAPNTIRDALWWMMGSVSDATPMQILVLGVYVAIGGGALVILGRSIDVLALGEDAAAGLGLDADRAVRWVFLAASLVAAATVAAAGLIGFVGLVVPHIVRTLGERRHRGVIVASALVGATFVIIADVGARTLRAPSELPVGAVTALVGVPFFLVRLRRFT